MAAGLAALLDDVAALARLAAASTDDVAAAAGRASVKAAGVVVDDTAVTPQYLEGVSPARELPMVRKIAMGSIVNKLVIILPIALLLSSFAPWAIPWILIAGGTYLSFEGAEKLWEMVRRSEEDTEPAVLRGAEAEKKVVWGAIRTDLILSAEIMMIALAEVDEEPVANQAMILVVVGLLITAVVYGIVALIVKMDDIGLTLSRRENAGVQRFGAGMVAAMPKVLRVISVIGTVAMTWVGGHIILVNTAELGWHGPYDLVHHLADPVHHLAAVGGVLAWLVETVCAFVLGAIWGGIIAALVHILPFHGGDGHGDGQRA